MTLQQQAIHAINFLGYGLIGLGLFAAFLNWFIFAMQIRANLLNEGRYSSMIGGVGLLMPIGCLVTFSIRVHALWIWLLDPFTVYLVFSPLYYLIRHEKRD